MPFRRGSTASPQASSACTSVSVSLWPRERVSRQLAAQLSVVEDLAVVGDEPAAGGILHRLVARGSRVHDREPSVRHAHRPTYLHATVVGTAMGQSLSHPGQRGPVRALPR